MSSNPHNGKPRIAVVSDRNDASLQDLVAGLRGAGAFVDVLMDVYTVMRGLAGGAMLDRVLVDVRTLDQEEMRFLRLAPRYYSAVDFTVPLLDGTAERLGSRLDRFSCDSVATLVTAIRQDARVGRAAPVATSPVDMLVASPVSSQAGVEVAPPAEYETVETTDTSATERAEEGEALLRSEDTETGPGVGVVAAVDDVESMAVAEAFDPDVSLPELSSEPSTGAYAVEDEPDVADVIAGGRDDDAYIEVTAESVWDIETESQMLDDAQASLESVADIETESRMLDDAQAALELAADDEADSAPFAEAVEDPEVPGLDEGAPSNTDDETPRGAAAMPGRAPLSTDGGLNAAPDGLSLHEAVRMRMAGDDPRFVRRRRPPGAAVEPAVDPAGEPGDAGYVEEVEAVYEMPAGEAAEPRPAPGISTDQSSLSSEEMDALLGDESTTEGEASSDSETRDGGAA